MEPTFMHMGYGFGLGFLNFIGTILFFIFLFWLFKMFAFGRGWRGGKPWKQMKYAGGPWGRGGWYKGEDAVETARERFARGEISKEQYDAIKAGLDAEKSMEADGHDWRSFWKRDDALEVARVRFAKGEISLEEYRAIKQALS
jgi:putative membrane protein